MRVYARVEDGVVVEMVTPGPDLEGNQYPLEECFPASFVEQCVEVTNVTPMPSVRWTYDGQTFSPEVIPEPTPEDILTKNTRSKDYYLDIAQRAMAPVLVSLQLGDATDEETLLAKAWQTYYRDLQVVDLTVENPAWPEIPQ